MSALMPTNIERTYSEDSGEKERWREWKGIIVSVPETSNASFGFSAANMKPSRLVPIFILLISCKSLQSIYEFSCTGIRDCNCSSSNGQYGLLCYGRGENHILSTIRPYSFIQLECMPETSASDYDAFQGLKVGPVPHVDFRLCPLPEKPLSELLSSIGVTEVTSLKFQSHRNLGNTLDKTHLAGLGNLTKLLLMNNNLTDLEEDFLGNLPGLTWLDLKENNVRLGGKFFEPVPDLEVLELGDNKLGNFQLPRMSNLRKLKLLNLWKNNLVNVTRDMFSGLSSLEQLDLSSNSIVSLPKDAFSDLKNLIQLSLYSNNFEIFPRGLLSENKNLEVFRLHDNHQSLNLEEGSFENLPKLEEVYLMRNNITSVPENIFWGSGAVNKIYLQGNALSELPQFLFRDQKDLTFLDLSENFIQFLPEKVFVRLNRLETLKLGYNKIKRIERQSMFGLYNLEFLDIEHNDLVFMDSESLSHLSQLKTAHFSHNKLSFLAEEEDDSEMAFSYEVSFGSSSPFKNCITLENLFLSNNSITEIFSDWRLNLIGLKTLDLTYNHIEQISTFDIQFLGQNLTVDLRHNQISRIVLDDLETLALSQSSRDNNYFGRNVRLLLEENPLDCDCQAYEFFRYLERKLDPSTYLLVNLEAGDLKCDRPNYLSGISVGKVNSTDLTCLLGGGSECPKGCRCFFRRYDLGLLVNCTYSGLTEIPGVLPRMNSTNHTELLLDGNFIGKLPDLTFPGYEKVTHLHLSSNNISSIGPGMLSRQIRVLTLDDNNLTALSGNLIKFLSESRGIHTLTLHNNPWKCDCSARDLLDLIQQKFKEIPSLGNVTCSEGNEPLSKLSVSDLCPVSVAIIVLCITAAVFGLLAGTLAALYYRYQREVKVWLYSHRFCLWFVTEEELDRDKIYDAFVSYSHKDENFVANILVPELESGENPFKLCLHYRDWIAGEWIPNQIARSVENSRRTLVILSPNFLESEWSRMEFRAAHKQALSEGRGRVIVILYGDVGPTEDLDSELRAYISMNTYVKWGDRWFWDKLKYALPHPPDLARTNLNFLRRRSIKKEKNLIDDKLELIRKLDLSSSQQGETTPPPDGIPDGIQPNQN